MRPQTAFRAVAKRGADPAEAPALAALDPSIHAALRAAGRVERVHGQ